MTVISLPVLTFLISRVQRAALVEEAVQELERLFASAAVPTYSLNPKHREGFACVTGEWRRAPLTGIASNSLAHDAAMALPSLPAVLRAELDSSRPRLDAMRSCADSEFVAPFVGAEPLRWRDDDYRNAVRTLVRATETELRALTEDGDWDGVAMACAPTLELIVQQSHINLISTSSVLHQLRRLVPFCVRALTRLDAVARAALAPRYARLAARMPHRAALSDAYRIEDAASALSSELDDEQRARLPWLRVSSWSDPPQPFDAIRVSRAVRLTQPILRRLVQHVGGGGPELEADLLALRRIDDAWWAPAGWGQEHTIRLALGSLDDIDAMIALVATSAAGGTDWGPTVWRTWSGISLNLHGGKTLEIQLLAQ